jgi:putative transferase (TIGR04331 family)
MVKKIKELSFNYHFSRNKKVFYADGWCLKNKLFDNLNDNKIITSYYKTSDKDKHYKKCKGYKKIIRKRVFKILNAHHLERYSDRQWEILIGHWLNRFIELIYNRYHQLKFILENFSVEKFYLIKSQEKYSTRNSKDYILSCQKGTFNDKLNLELLKFFSLEKKITFLKQKKINNNEKILRSSFFKNFIINFLNIIPTKQKYFIIDPYMSQLENITFQFLYLKQFPKIWKSPNLKDIDEDKSLRDQLSHIYNFRDKDEFLNFFFKILFKIIPRVYLEGFKSNKLAVKKSIWPQNPKVVVTANAFDTNEYFKFWLVNKVKKIKYYTIQHGANYGVAKHDVNPSIEELTSDKFITWGYKNYPAQVKGFNIKLIKKINRDKQTQDKIILFLKPSPRRDFLWNDSLEFKTHLNANIKFIQKLNREIKFKLVIKKHFAKEFYNFDVEKILNKKFNKLNFTKENYNDLIKSNKLFLFINIHSTGFLETLSYNIPCLYVKDTYYEYKTDYLKDLKKLSKVNIYFETLEEASKFVNENYHNLSKWWDKKSLQKQRLLFVNKYSKLSKNKLRDLFKLIHLKKNK